jgi:hypothetical protein
MSDETDTVAGIGSVMMAIGFLGLVIDMAVKYSPAGSLVGAYSDFALWILSAFCAAGFIIIFLGSRRHRATKQMKASA